MNEAWYEAMRTRHAKMTDAEKDALHAELGAALDRRVEDQEDRSGSPESAEEFKARLRSLGWTEERISAWEATGFAAARRVTGAEADIEANYPGGYAAFVQGEPRDRTPYHKGEIEGL